MEFNLTHFHTPLFSLPLPSQHLSPPFAPTLSILCPAPLPLRLSSPDPVELLQVAHSYTLDRVLRSVHCVRCCSLAELLAVVYLLPEMVEENPAIKLVVIDSVASPFRAELPDARLRTRVLNGMAQSLIKLAAEKGLAVSGPTHLVCACTSVVVVVVCVGEGGDWVCSVCV